MTLPYCFSAHFSDKGVTFLLSYNLRNIIKTKLALNSSQHSKAMV